MALGDFFFFYFVKNLLQDFVIDMSGRYLQLQCRVELRDHGNICIV